MSEKEINHFIQYGLHQVAQGIIYNFTLNQRETSIPWLEAKGTRRGQPR